MRKNETFCVEDKVNMHKKVRSDNTNPTKLLKIEVFFLLNEKSCGIFYVK